MQILVAYEVSERYAGYLILFFLYIIAYLVGIHWDDTKTDKWTLVAGCVLIAISVSIRLAGKIFVDGTTLYDVFIAFYTHVILAFGIFLMVSWFVKAVKNKKVPSIIRWIDYYSYEIYLVHYMFYKGPFYLSMTGNAVLNSLLIIIASIIAAVVLKFLTERIFNVINKAEVVN